MIFFNMQPVRSVYPNYMSRDPKLKEQSENDILAWQDCEMRLQTLLRKAAVSTCENRSLSKEQCHRFYLSGKTSIKSCKFCKQKHVSKHHLDSVEFKPE